MFEGMRPGEGRYFVQSLTAVRAEAKPEQVFGEWHVSRGTDESICVITLSNKPAGENFSLELKPGCGALVTGFNPDVLAHGPRGTGHLFRPRLLALRGSRRDRLAARAGRHRPALAGAADG